MLTGLVSLALLYPGDYELKRTEPKPGTQQSLEAMLRDRRKEMRAAARALASGALEPDDWAMRVYASLLEGHTSAYRLGRIRAGEMETPTEIDLIMGSSKADLETQFLQSFLADVKAGRYTDAEGQIRQELIAMRSEMYLGKMQATGTEAWVQHGADDDIWWDLGAAEHCDDCPLLAANSPYRKGTLYTTPRAGDTQCRFNCDCSLRRADGSTGFSPVSLR